MSVKPYLLGNISSTSLVFFCFDHTGNCGPVSMGCSVGGERKTMFGAHQRTQKEIERLNHCNGRFALENNSLLWNVPEKWEPLAWCIEYPCLSGKKEEKKRNQEQVIRQIRSEN
jgi:hypothetical protein